MNTGASLLDGKTDDWGIVMDINVIGTCTVTREVLSIMREAVSTHARNCEYSCAKL